MKFCHPLTQRFALSAVLFASLAMAAGTLAAPKESTGDPKKQAAQALKKNFDSVEQFNAAAANAAKAGVSPQTIAEAKLAYCCVNENTAALPEVLGQLDQILPAWKESDSMFFQKRTELEGLMNFGKALVAEQANDEAGFEKFIKEAFWQAPDAGALFQKKIQSHRSKAHQASITLPMDLKISTSGGAETSLGELVKGKKAVLLDFWASWCGPCMSLMTELNERAKKLAPLGVTVVAMNSEGTDFATAKTKAEKVRKDRKMDLPWLVEPAGEPFTKPLEITSIPRAVLVSPEGKILYNDHPSDPGLAAALSKLGVQLAAH